MIIIGLVIGFIAFVVLALLCIMLEDVSSLEWVLIAICAFSGILCGYGASKSKAEKAK